MLIEVPSKYYQSKLSIQWFHCQYLPLPIFVCDLCESEDKMCHVSYNIQHTNARNDQKHHRNCIYIFPFSHFGNAPRKRINLKFNI